MHATFPLARVHIDFADKTKKTSTAADRKRNSSPIDIPDVC